MSAQHTHGWLQQGRLLSTKPTDRWSPEKRSEADAQERRMLFLGFTSADEGRSRVRVAICESEEYARRLVACWNRLEQFTAEQIEDFGYDLFADVRPHYDQAVNEARVMQAQRDELLVALDKMNRAYVRLLESGKDRIETLGGQCDPIDVMEASDPNLRDSRAAIAKVKGGAA